MHISWDILYNFKWRFIKSVVEVMTWISNYIQQKSMNVTTYPSDNLNQFVSQIGHRKVIKVLTSVHFTMECLITINLLLAHGPLAPTEPSVTQVTQVELSQNPWTTYPPPPALQNWGETVGSHRNDHRHDIFDENYQNTNRDAKNAWSGLVTHNYS